MIKKISQLNRLPEEFYDEKYFDEGTYDELERKKQGMLFEVSYETADTSNPARADEVNYYTSYSTELSAIEHMLGVDALKSLLSTIANGGLSVISGDLRLGNQGDEAHDRIDEYYPDLSSTVTSYSNIDLQNDLTVHGKTVFHNDVVLTCNQDVENKDKPILEVTGVAKFNQTIYGTAYRALWADLAEIYSADADYKPGTLVAFGGDKEITIAKEKANAIVTSKPAIVLNETEAENMEHPTAIALIGRVPVNVRGPVKKFDKIVLSRTEPGTAVVYNFASNFEVIGRTLEENLNPDNKLVMCAVKLNLL